MLITKMETIETARKKLQEMLPKLDLRVECIGTDQALDRVLAEDIRAEEDVPGFCRTAMDGYAVRCADAVGASGERPVRLTMIGEVQMGHAPEFVIGENQCAYVPTGGMMPAGADGIVIIEDTANGTDIPEQEDGGVSIDIYREPSQGANLVFPGEDMNRGETVLRRGQRLRAQDIGVLAALGKTQVSVYAPLRMAILSTGDELVGIEEIPEPGQVRDINSYTMMALAQRCHMEVTRMALIGDSPEVMEDAVRQAMQEADIIAISGGSSVGKKDFAARIIDRVAAPGVFVHGIAMKPGKPTILGLDETSRSLIVGVPGHPASALMSFELIVMDVFREYIGMQRIQTIPAILSGAVKAKADRDTCVTVTLTQNADGSLTAAPCSKKSGAITMLAGADGFIQIPAGKSLDEGELVMVRPI